MSNTERRDTMNRKKALFLLLLLLLILMILVLAGQLLLMCEWPVERDVLYLKDGTTIIADEASEGGNLIYYVQDGTTHFLTNEDVEYLGKGDFQAKKTGKDIVQQYIHSIRIESPGIARAAEWFSRVTKSRLTWIVLVFVVGAGYLMVRSVKRPRPKKDIISDGLHIKDPASEIRKIDFEALSDLEKIVAFFLKLYKRQIGAPADTISDFRLSDIKTFGANKVYQLRVKHDGEWASRRMTIGPLGEESGSKSKCYYVIYDVHMVVKVPPVPIDTFNTYIESIRKEGHIVNKLSPRECITPRVSVIMQRAYSYTRQDLPPDLTEQRYIKQLEKRPELQDYLKVGSTFVFFMDLSKYFFLGHIINSLHNMDKKMRDEILQNPQIMWDTQAFSGRYGLEDSDPCLQIQNLFAEYESEIKKNPPQGGAGESSILQYRIKEWFVAFLSGNKIHPNDKNLDIETAEYINAISEDVFNRHCEAVDTYKATVRQYVQSISFAQNKAQIESIVLNMIDLLAWLRKKKVAMRDLKPDNLIVAGDTENYPKFLASADQFTIGLIDVETAVDYDAPDNNGIPQPQIGGTPNYATPTHLFPNDALCTVFKDLPRILHLQDWQAIVAIIYKVATGETLFQKTGKLMPAIVAQIESSEAENTPARDIIINAGKIFWPSAVAEFNAKINAQKPILDMISITVSGEILNMIKAEAMITHHYFTEIIETDIESQTLFPDLKTRQKLRVAPSKTITNILTKMEKGHEISGSSATQRKVVFLQSLEKNKQLAELSTEMQERLDQPSVTLTLSELLDMMFNITQHAMVKTDRKTSGMAAVPDVPESKDDHEYEKTI